MRKSDAFRAYETKVRDAFLAQLGKLPPLDGPVAVIIRWFRARRSGDVDAPIKAVLDSLQGLAFVDDRQVEELRVFRGDDAKNPRAEVEVVELWTAGTTPRKKSGPAPAAAPAVDIASLARSATYRPGRR